MASEAAKKIAAALSRGKGKSTGKSKAPSHSFAMNVVAKTIKQRAADC